MNKNIINNIGSYILLCMVSLLMMFPYVCPAQITGVIVDEASIPIKDASIQIKKTSDTQILEFARTTDKGSFSIPTDKVIATNCILTVSHTGYVGQVFSLENVPQRLVLDTIKLDYQELQEVVVSASKTRVDRQLLFPTQKAVKRSSTGFDLLQNMPLPGVHVNMEKQKVEKRGAGDIPIYINEKRASQMDVVALRPDEVVRIEYIDRPGVEFGLDAPTAVINFIVKPRVSGFAAGANMHNAITTPNGANYFYAQLNHKLSKWGVFYQNNYAKVEKRRIDQTSTYTLANGQEHEISREGINTNLAYQSHSLGINYDLTKSNNYSFMAQLEGNFYDSPNRGHRQRINETGKPSYYALTEPTEHYFSPTIDLFFRKYLPNNRRLVFNIVGTIIDTEYGYKYETYDDEYFTQVLSRYGYNTKGKHYSLISDAKYSHPLGNMTWISGINYKQGYTKNIYEGNHNTVNSMHNSSMYVYTQFGGSFKKIQYLLGLGVSYEQYSQAKKNYNYFLLRPNISLNYQVFINANLRYTFNLTPNSPSLASLSNNRQQSNEFEYHVGNPELKPYTRITQMLTFSYKHPKFYIENTVGCIFSKKPIMEIITRQYDSQGKTWFDFSYENQTSLREYWNYLNLQFYVVPDIFTLEGGFSYLFSRNEGRNYLHKFHRNWGYIGVSLNVGKWNMTTSWSARERNFGGETETITGQNVEFQINYRYNPRLTVGIFASRLFQKEGDTSRELTINQFVQKSLTVSIPEWGNLLTLRISWHFDRGRKYQSDYRGNRYRDNESGILKSK